MDSRRVVVLGAGPGGMSTALWCASLGLDVTVLERRDRPGGQLCDISHPIDDLPGLPGISGSSLALTLRSQLTAARVEVLCDHPATLDPGALRVHCDTRRRTFDAAAVVFAAGARRRTLGVPGERALTGRGVASNVGNSAPSWRDTDVLVVGGGDDAFEHLALLAPYARSIVLVHRTDAYTARPALRVPVPGFANVTLRPFTRVEAIEGATSVESVRLRTPAGTETLPVSAVFVCIGPLADTDGVGAPTDPGGYISVDRLQRTRRPGVWAVGDVCCPEAPTIATAIGQGAVAAKSIDRALRGVSPDALPWPVHREGSPVRGVADRLSVAGITLPARIGVYPRERRRTQTLSFDVGFDVDAATAASDDTLPRTVDYASVERAIAELLGARHFNLIETVAETVATELLTRFACPNVRVRVTKPGVPQRQSTASVEVFRSRGG